MNHHRLHAVLLNLLILGLLLGFASLSRADELPPPPNTKTSPPPLPAPVQAALGGLQIPFVENRGQQDPEVAFYAQTLAGTVYVTRAGRLVYALPQTEAGGWTLVEEAVGATPQVSAGPTAATQVSYFHGNDPAQWRSGVSTVHSVELGEPWPGVRLTVQARGKQVEKLFTLAPGVSADAIQMQVKGTQGLTVADDGALHLTTGQGEVRLTAPQAWQELAGERQIVAVAYRQLADDRYGFTLGEHDPQALVVIDPLLQSTYLGGSGSDIGGALAIHPTSGEIYLSGFTYSTDFPGTTGGAQDTTGGSQDAFVARLSADLQTLHQAIYLGGSGNDYSYSLAIHPTSGEIYLGGGTTSTADFPGTTGGAQSSSGGNYDAFVARLSADLKTLVQATYLGGSVGDIGGALAIHPTIGDIYLGGYTDSTNFPGTTGGAQDTTGGSQDAFVARLSADLKTLVQATYLGGSGIDDGYSLAIHPTGGEIYFGGSTASTDFPGTTGGAQDTTGGSQDAFVARLSADLKTLVQATYLGGSGIDDGYSLAIHPTSGEIYFGGSTASADFPGTTSGAQSSSGGNYDAFVARLSADLKTLVQATYLGGSGYDDDLVLVIRPTGGDIYLGGDTESTNFPGTTGGAQPSSGGGQDGFAARLSADLQTLLQVTYLGGSGREDGFGLAIHPTTGDIYLGGYTESTDFPGTTGGAQSSNSDNSGAFVARLTADLQAGPTVSSIVLANSSPTAAASVTWTVTFSTAVTGLSASHFALVPNGITGAAITNVSETSGTGANATWTVTASTGAGDGTLGLNMVNATGVTPTVTNLPFTGEVYTITHTHIVTPVAGAGGTINPNTPQTVNDGATATFTVTPDPNYAIQTVTGCGGTLVGTTYTTGPITADCTVYASFVATAYSLTVSQAGVGSGTVTGSGINCGVSCTATYPVGTSVTLTATPNAGSTFLGWSGVCEGAGNCTLTMSAVQKVTALFGLTTAKTLVVNKIADTDDGSCDVADCSLREAVGAAQSGDTITFAPSLNGQIITLSALIDLDLNKSMTIQGPGASQLAIEGKTDGGTQLFRTGGNSNVVVILDGLTLQNGISEVNGGAIYHGGGHLLIRHSVLSANRTPGGGGAAIWNDGNLAIQESTLTGNIAGSLGVGGAIANYGTLAVTSSRFTANQAGTGGAIYSNYGIGAGPVTIQDCVFENNQTDSDGGAVYNGDGNTLTIRSSVLNGNQATSGGGAIWNYSSAKSVIRVENSTLSNNTANYGGGLANWGTATVSASTVSGNTAQTIHGGGIQNAGTLTVLDSTVSGNAATDPTTGGYGGGIYGESGSSTLVSDSTITGNQAIFGGGIKSYGPLMLGNTLVAGNTATSDGQEIWVEAVNWNSQGHNLVGQNGNAGMGGGATLNAPDFTPAAAIDAILALLADNGGPTWTHLLVAGSPAIDAGDNALIPAGMTTDQRGAARIQDGGVGAFVDVGAVEGTIPLPTTYTVTPSAGAHGSISPNIPQSATLNQQLIFTVTPDAGYTASVGGTCGGALVGTTYTTAPVTADCTVIASFNPFSPATYTVTPSAGAHGSISPNTPQPATLNQRLIFTVTPDAGYTASVGGTCGGALVGTTYTTAPVTADCTVIASFSTLPTLSINNVSQAEGNSGTTPFTFTVTLSAAASLPVTVNWATADGTATAGSDYTAAAGSLTFPVGGPLTQTLTVQVIGDTAAETNETFFVNLSAPVNATLAQAQGVGTILNDDSLTGLSGIAWSGTRFVVVEAGGAIRTSADGVGWTAITPPPTSQDLHGIAWSGSQFVTVGSNGAILASPTGAIWTVITPPPTSQDLHGIVWSGSRFITVGSNGAILSSPDGATWTPQNAGTTADLSGIAWSGDQFVAVGSAGTILSSASGAGWMPRNAGTTADLSGIAWSGNQFVAVGSAGAILSSPDGMTWTNQSTGAATLYGIAWSGYQFLAVGSNGAILSSPDGIAWTASALATTQDLLGIAWSGSQFIIIDANHALSVIARPWGDDRPLASNLWTLIGLPAAPSAPGTVQSVLGASLTGTYGTDWVVWSHDDAAYQYFKLELSDTLAPGEGHWIRKYSPGPTHLATTGSTTPVVTSPNCPSATGCYEITLTAPASGDHRYHLLGMPFPYPVGWWEARIEVDGVAYPLDARENVYVSPGYWVWNGNSYDSYDGRTPGMVGMLQPWQGVWINVYAASQGHTVKLLIPRIPKYSQTAPPAPATRRGSQALDWLIAPAAAESPTTSLSEREARRTAQGQAIQDGLAWYVRLIAQEPTLPMRDRNAVFGQLPDAAVDHDDNDLPKLAPFGQPYLSVVFPHLDWGSQADDYASDYHPNRDAQGRGLPADAWRFEIRTDRTGYPVRLRWEGSPAVLACSTLVDEDTGARYPADNPRTFQDGAPVTMTAPVRHFSWIYAGQPCP